MTGQTLKASEMDAATTVADADEFLSLQGGVNKRTPFSVVKNAMLSLAYSGLTSLSNFGKFLLTSSETTLQSALEKIDAEMSTDGEVYVAATDFVAADADGFCQAQQLAEAGFLTLNGALISDGAWTAPSTHVYSGINMYCAGDMSGVNFRFVYYNTLNVLTTSAWIAGANAGTKIMVSGALGLVSIEADAAVGTDVTFGTGTPALLIGPQIAKHFLVDEAAMNWYANAVNWENKLSSTALANGRDGICSLTVLKDATPRTITFAGIGGLTAKVMGSAMEAGSASKYVSYTLQVNARKDIAFWRNAGAEV